MRALATNVRRRLLLLVGALLPCAGLILAVGLGAGSPGSGALIATHRAGYVIVARDGGVFNFGGAAFHGSTGNLQGPSPIVGVASRASLDGYWTAAADGGVFAFGDATFYGPTGGLHPNHPIVGITATPAGKGYWLVADDGGVFSFGDASFHGSTGNLRLNSPIAGITATPTGKGYWLVADDGGVFSFGDASFHGSTGNLRLNSPIAGITATPTGDGYWLVADDGGVFSFGDASFHGSTGNLRLNSPIAGITATPTGDGYWLVADDGGVFSFGDATFQGSTGALKLNSPIVGIVATAAVDDPPSVAITGGLNAFNKPGTLSASGTASDPDGVVRSVQVSVDGGAFATTNVTCSGCGHSTATWAWTSKVALAEGSHQIAFRATDDGGSASSTMTATVKVDGTAPTVQITAGPANGGYSATAKPSLSGSAADSGGSGIKSVSASIDGGAFSTSPVSCTGCNGTSSSWSFTAASNLSEGSHTIAFRSTDAAGNVSTSASRTFTIDTLNPDPPVVATVPTVNLANKTSVTVSGTSEANAAINLTVTDAGNAHTVTGTGTANGTGNWTISAIDMSTLTDGSVSATATATDAAHVSASSTPSTAAKDTVAPAVTVSSAATANAANENSVPLSGTVEAGATVSVVASDGNGHSTAPVAATVSGTGWSANVDVHTLDDATITYSATATDAHANASVATRTAGKDTVAPPAPIVVTVPAVTSSNSTSVTVLGTAEAGATIDLTLTDTGSAHTATGSATADGNGDWTIANLNLSGLDDGTINVTATATDAAGNVSVTSNAETADKDTQGPALTAVAGIDGGTDLTLTFDEPVLCSSVGLVAFVVTIDGFPAVALSVDCVGTSSNTLTVSLLLPLSSTDEVHVVIGASTITDIYGNGSLQLTGDTTIS